MRRNVISLLIWLSVVAIFTIHLILTHRKEETHTAVNERSITHVKTTILKTTQLENFQTNNKDDETSKDFTNESKDMDEMVENKRDLEEKSKAADEADRSMSIQIKLQEKYQVLENEAKTLKTENTRLLEREKQFKTLATRLATKLKGKEGGLLPKLDPVLPWIFAISPTYSRFTQKPDLIRLSQTLLHVTNFHWIIVEDSSYKTEVVSNLLQESGLSFTHLSIRTPNNMQRKKGEKHNKHHRGVVQRNLGLKWLRDNVNIKKTPGVIYFMDDDNTYHRKIFDEVCTF